MEQKRKEVRMEEDRGPAWFRGFMENKVQCLRGLISPGSVPKGSRGAISLSLEGFPV